MVTDGERVLGLGDLGAGGLAISEGKILLYTTMAGVPPSACLPLCLDVGTNNRALLDDPAYKGLRRARLRGPSYDALVEELIAALRAWKPRGLVLQFEDFGAENAFALLERYRHGMVRCAWVPSGCRHARAGAAGREAACTAAPTGLSQRGLA